jgi:predicted ester cyclase
MDGFEEMSDKADANAAVVMKLYEECLNQKNYSMAEALVAPSLEAPGGQGVEGFLEIIRPLHAAFDPLVFEIEDIIAQGDRVVVRWTMRGTHSGVWAGAAPTHKPVQQTAIVIYQLKDGKIAAYWPMVDRLGLAMQLGLVVPGNGQASDARR